MATITREFQLYTNAGSAIPPVIYVNQYDRDEIWLFKLYEPSGQRFIPTDAAIVGIKADGNIIANAGTVSGGIVRITETEQMTAAPGNAVFEILFDGDTHGTANFIVMVEPSPTDDGVASESDLSLFQQAIDSISPATINAAVSAWMSAQLTPSQWVIDNSLTVANAAADAKKAGDLIRQNTSDIGDLTDLVTEDQSSLVSAINETRTDLYNWFSTDLAKVRNIYDGSASDADIHEIQRLEFTTANDADITGLKVVSRKEGTSVDTSKFFVDGNELIEYVIGDPSDLDGTVVEEISDLKSHINNAIYDSATTIDFSTAETVDRIISSSTGKWIVNGQSYMIPIPTGQDRLFITSNATNGSILALLTDNRAQSGALPNYATGASRQFIAAGERSEFEIPSDCTYICLMKSYSTTDYTPQSAEYVVDKTVGDGSITKSKLDASLQAAVDAVPELESHFVENANLANPNTVTSGLVISSSGVETANSSYDTSDYISVEPGSKYSWKNLSYVCRYGADKNWLGRTSATSQTSITLAPTVYFVRVCGSTGTADNWRFNKGDSVIDLPYTDGAYLAENVQLTNQLDGVNENISNLQSSVDLLTPSYGVPYIPSIPYSYTGESIVPYKTSGHLADIYALYDALCTQYPQYIRKQVLGMDASGQYEVRAYRIDNGTNYAYRYPRFVWLSSIHGNEGNSTISTYYMVKELLEKFGSDPVCYGIMSAVRLYVVPAVNPWGVENYSRLNYNHVNLNRNFPVDWVYRDPNLAYGTEKYGIMSASNSDNPYYYYGGGTCVYDDATQTATTTYVAEAETQLIMNFVNSLNTGANLNGKVSFAVNKHDAGNMTEEGATILIRDNYESDRKFMTNFLNWMKPLLMSKQNWLTEKSGLNLSTVSYDMAGDSASAGTMDKWLNYSGIHGCLCEIPKGAGTAYTDRDHFADLCAINVDVGLNMINNTIINNAKLKDNTQTEQYVIVS